VFKFIHAADIHLDSPQRGLDRYEGAPVAECRGSTRRALENLVDLAVTEKVAFVLIVGDLYDGDWRDYNTGLFFGKQMAKLRDAAIPVYLIRGNHDAANGMTKDLKLVDNVRMLSATQAETVVNEDHGAVVHGQSFAKRAVLENLSRSYPARRPGYVNIGILHTCFDGKEGHEPYAPCSQADLQMHGYDYWALGHIHKREFLQTGDPWIVFPGNIQGRHVREQGPKGCMLVTVDDNQVVSSVEPRWLDVMRWDTCRVDVTGVTDCDQMIVLFLERMQSHLALCDDRLLALRVEIHGVCQVHQTLAARVHQWTNEIRLAAIDAGAGKVWVEKVILKTTPPRSPREDVLNDGPLVELAIYMANLKQDNALLTDLGSRALGELTRKLPAELSRELDSADGIRALLDQAEPLLIQRLLTKVERR
jgi:DNA repair protein SbcD/Mre11